MGIDKPNVRTILHYGCPSSLEAYYQQAGRAGRDGAQARCVLFWNHQDFVTQAGQAGSRRAGPRVGTSACEGQGHVVVLPTTQHLGSACTSCPVQHHPSCVFGPPPGWSSCATHSRNDRAAGGGGSAYGAGAASTLTQLS